MREIIKKILKHKYLSVFLVFLFLFSFVHKTYAYVDQTITEHAAALDAARGWSCTPPAQPQTQSDETPAQTEEQELNAEAYGDFSTDNIAWTMVGALGGIGQTNCPEKQVRFINGSVLGMTKKGIELVYANPPASSGDFVMDALARAKIISPTYAQGIGFSALSPLIPIWRVFRNVTYVIMIVVLIVLGFLIMFRKSLDPQTAISIQTALPRIVMTLLLITFSYAIAGLVIDFMYFAILLIISVFGQAGLLPLEDIGRVQQEFIGGGFWALLRNTFATIPKTMREGGSFGGGILGKALGFIGIGGGPLGIVVGWFAGGILGNVISGGNPFDPVSIFGSIISPFVMLGMLLVFIFAFFRLLFMLFNAYLQIIINILFAPFMLVADVIPGGHGFTNWVTNLIGHALVFPTTIAMLLIGHAITRSADHLWTPPLVPQAGGRFVEALIGIGVVIMIPSIVKQVQELFKASAPVSVTPGTAVSPAVGPLGQMYGLYMGALQYKQLTGKSLIKAVPGAQRLAQAIGFGGGGGGGGGGGSGSNP